MFVADGCHLCDVAVAVVRDVCGEGLGFGVVDITDVPELERRYRAVIPLVEIDGVERFRYEVDEQALRAAVSGISA